MTASSVSDPSGTDWSMLAQCGICFRGVLFHLSGGNARGVRPESLTAPDILNRTHFVIQEVFPEGPADHAIANLPATVESAFNEAEGSFAAARYSAAAVMYRKAVERSVKHIAPDGKGPLAARIRALEGKHALPHAMIELMEMVKFLGNDGAHDDEDPTSEDVARGRDFTRLLLVYLWDLPAKVAIARARRETDG